MAPELDCNNGIGWRKRIRKERIANPETVMPVFNTPGPKGPRERRPPESQTEATRFTRKGFGQGALSTPTKGAGQQGSPRRRSRGPARGAPHPADGNGPVGEHQPSEGRPPVPRVVTVSYALGREAVDGKPRFNGRNARIPAISRACTVDRASGRAHRAPRVASRE